MGLSQVALGLAHGLGVSGGGANLVAWGDGGFEQTTIPTTLPSVMTAVSAGHYHSVVLGSANQVVAWGLEAVTRPRPGRILNNRGYQIT